MSEKSSDDADKAWDDDPKDEPGAESGEAEIHRVDTVPPPASGDAYSADTVIRDVPREALEAIRENRKSSEKRRAAESSEAAPKELAVTTEEKPIAKKVAAAVAHAPPRAVVPPVTSGEILIAFGAAVALIVVGFYVIGSAF